MKRHFYFLFIFLLSTFNLFAQSSTFSGSGNWNNAGRWNNGIPTSGTAVTIANGASCTINVAAVCASMTMASGNSNTTVTVSGTNSLTVGGAISISFPTSNSRTKKIDASGGTITCTGITLGNPSGGSNRICEIALNTGTINCTGDITFTGSTATENELTFNGAGLLKLGGTITGTGTFTRSTGTVDYNKAGNQTVFGTTYNKLKISGSGVKTINANTVVDKTLNLEAGELALNGFELTLSDTVKRNTGTITGSGSSDISISGTVDSVKLFMTQTSSSTRSLNNLTTTRPNGVFIADTLELNNTLDISNASYVNANGKLILTSNANGTARVNNLSNGTVTGNVITQRFIPGGNGKRRWRFLSSAVNVNGAIPYSQLIDDIHVTGTGGTANGFDNATTNSSARTYDETISGASGNGWANPANINVTVPKGMGISVFVRGSRSLADPFLNWTVPDDATIDFVGKLNQGEVNVSSNITFTNTGTPTGDGFCLVGNPYMSNIDWEAASITKTNIGSVIYALNPTTGSYATYDVATSTGVNGGTRYISAGQGFFIRTNAASPVLKFQEAAKVTNAGGNFFKSLNNPIINTSSNFAKIKLTATRDSVSSDELVVVLGDTAKREGTDGSDAAKFFNDNTLNFYTRSTELRNLAINYFPKPTANDTIRVSFFSTVDGIKFNGTYSIKVTELSGLPSNLMVYLWDTYANQMVNLKETNEYIFNLNTDVASAGNDRFKILFKQDTSTVTKITNFTGSISRKKVNITWSTNKEKNINYYFVERSKDQVKFSKLKPTQIVAYNNGDGFNSYTIIDNNPSKGMNYYRVSMVDSANNINRYSEVIAIEYKAENSEQTDQVISNIGMNKSEISILTYPNPGSEYVFVYLQGLSAEENYQISIQDIMGKEVMRTNYTSNSAHLPLNIASLNKGVYIIKGISNNNNTLASTKLIKN